METPVRIRPIESGSDAEAFRRLNEAWITEHFELEDKDRAALSDPFAAIVAAGGQVFVAVDGNRVVGTVALIRHAADVYELSKMTVAVEARGHGMGRQLLLHAVAQARALGAHRVILGSSTKLPSAVHLYEAVGFKHVPAEGVPEMRYARASVFMRLELGPGGSL